MNSKLIHKVNGGLAIYYGIGFMILALAGIIVSGLLFFKWISGNASFPWLSIAGLLTFTIVMGLIGYSILRVGYEEIEK